VAYETIVKKVHGQKTTYQLRHLLQMHTTNYMPFIREKAALKNSQPIGEGPAAPTALPSLNPPLVKTPPKWHNPCRVGSS